MVIGPKRPLRYTQVSRRLSRRTAPQFCYVHDRAPNGADDYVTCAQSISVRRAAAVDLSH